MPFSLHSPVFQNGGAIPERYARTGHNVSPPLRWTDAPPEAKSFFLLVEDPDAPSGTFRHWAMHGIRSDQTSLREGAGANEDQQHQAINDFGNARYDGPQPPPGDGPHHYHFRLAALDMARLNVPPGVTAEDAWALAQPHVIEEAELVGVFGR